MFAQLVHSFEARSLFASMFWQSPLRNRAMVFAFFLSFGLTLLSVYEPGLASFIELHSMDGNAWALVFIAVGAHIVIIELEKLLLRHLRDAGKIVA